jgi:hypothetical protein
MDYFGNNLEIKEHILEKNGSIWIQYEIYCLKKANSQ